MCIQNWSITVALGLLSTDWGKWLQQSRGNMIFSLHFHFQTGMKIFRTCVPMHGEDSTTSGVFSGRVCHWPQNPRDPLSPPPHCWDYRHTPPYLAFKMWALGMKFRFSHLLGIYFATGGISPAPSLFICSEKHSDRDRDLQILSWLARESLQRGS